MLWDTSYVVTVFLPSVLCEAGSMPTEARRAAMSLPSSSSTTGEPSTRVDCESERAS